MSVYAYVVHASFWFLVCWWSLITHHKCFVVLSLAVTSVRNRFVVLSLASATAAKRKITEHAFSLACNYCLSNAFPPKLGKVEKTERVFWNDEIEHEFDSDKFQIDFVKVQNWFGIDLGNWIDSGRYFVSSLPIRYFHMVRSQSHEERDIQVKVRQEAKMIATDIVSFYCV